MIEFLQNSIVRSQYMKGFSLSKIGNVDININISISFLFTSIKLIRNYYAWLNFANPRLNTRMMCCFATLENSGIRSMYGMSKIFFDQVMNVFN